jgi:type I restriction enzyme M protein
LVFSSQSSGTRHLSINRYKEVVHEVVEYEKPAKILADLKKLEEEIMTGMVELEGMLK